MWRGAGPCPISGRNPRSPARAWHTCWHAEGLDGTPHSLAVFEEAGLPAGRTRQRLSSAATRTTARARVLTAWPARGRGLASRIEGISLSIMILGVPQEEVGRGPGRACTERRTAVPCSQPSKRRLSEARAQRPAQPLTAQSAGWHHLINWEKRPPTACSRSPGERAFMLAGRRGRCEAG